MRYHEIQSGLRIPVSNEEREILNMAKTEVSKDTLDERQQELARMMVSRGLLDHYRKDHQTYFRASSITDIWRGPDDN